MSVAVVKYDLRMGRWEPDARGRLGEAALELYEERGFDETTVAEIAERAGLTERTFFRHYADKREVLFGGSEQLQELLVTTLESAPAEVGALDAVLLALEAAAAVIQVRPDFARRRGAIISANQELRARELVKLATLADATAETLRRRGVPEPAASLVAETGMAIFRVGYDRWVTGNRRTKLVQVLRETAGELRSATAAPAS
jgi:AcrR family transcriptional regulator